jgi:hypothetical protein
MQQRSNMLMHMLLDLLFLMPHLMGIPMLALMVHGQPSLMQGLTDDGHY